MPSSPANVLRIDPKPRFSLSPYLFMQFMEPLGTTDSSVAAAWDHLHDCWRDDLIEVTRELAPTLIRWGGIFCSYYRWKEGVGPRARRKPMYNLLWGGVESNQVGTQEFVEFCRAVGADPLITINMESDGRVHWAHPLKGGVRSAGPAEAAVWVDYCNNPANKQRRAHGAREPHNVRLWQLGNETSYSKDGFDRETAARRTLTFAKAMHRADPEIELIAWGDDGWAPRMIEVAEEHIKYVAVHHHFTSGLEHSPLNSQDYRRDPELTWRHLMHAWHSTDEHLTRTRAEIAGSHVGIALTESHFGLPGRNRCEVLSSWAAGVANARVLNTHQRHGDLLKIATLADFCGTRWMVNAVMLPTPYGPHRRAYLMPVARVMALYRHHIGKQAVAIAHAPEGLDVVASRTGSRLFLHVVNTHRTQPVRAALEVAGGRISSGKVFEIADDPTREIDETAPDLFMPVEKVVPRDGQWTFPAASVTAIEAKVAFERKQ